MKLAGSGMLFITDIFMIQYGDGFWGCPTLPHYRMLECQTQKAASDLLLV